MFDVLIRNARIVDGTGRPEYRGSVGISGGIIRAVGPLDWAEAATVIDAGERILAPGFVEAHGHSDFAVVANPACESHVAQGVTTEVFGNCGSSAYPFKRGGARFRTVPKGMELDWSTPAEYFAKLRSQGLGLNVVPLAGHAALKTYVTDGQDREVNADELKQMKSLLAEALEAGARGFSTGLTYDPVINTPTSELVELARVVGEYGGVYTTHIRSYYHVDYLDAIDEAAVIARAGGLPLVLSHLTVHGKGNWGRAAEILGRLDHYRTEGLDVYADTFTYPTIGVWWAPRSIFPLWAFGLTSPLDYLSDWAAMVQKLQATIGDPDGRARLKQAIEQRLTADKSSFLDQFFSLHGWDTVYIDEVAPGSPNQRLTGLSVEEAAQLTGADPTDLYLDLVMSEGEYLSSVNIVIRPEDHQAFLRYPHMMIGNDVRAINPELTDASFNLSQTSPRHYGSFVRMIQQHVMQDGTLDLPEAVRKMSALPCQAFGLSDRGLIKPGMAADIVVFDRYRMRERATYRQPNQYPEGVFRVLVNGVEVVRDGQFTGARPGKVLTR